MHRHPRTHLSSVLGVALASLALASGASGATSVGHSRSVETGRAVPKTQAPNHGQTISGRVEWKVAVRGAAPKSVDFKIDGRRGARLEDHRVAKRRRSATLDTTKLSNGRHTLVAIATSPNGRRTKSKVVVIVDNAPPPAPAPSTTPAHGPNSVYWGAWIGKHLTGTEAAWDMTATTKFEGLAQKNLSLIHFAAPFANCSTSPCTSYNFPNGPMNSIRQHGSIPFFSWSSQSIGQGGDPKVQPNFQLSDVIAGTYDAYIRNFAVAAKAWNHPFFLRFNWEMNGNWFAWHERANGNQPGEYVAAWRHVHDIFTSVGAANVSWVWCPNVDPSRTLQPLAPLYPGDSYVDWTCLDGYNWGTNPASPKGWKTFDELFKADYDLITGQIAPSKPMILGEFGSSEYGGSKAAWLQNALSRIPAYPKIRGALYFEKYDDNMDWPIVTSATATAAFAAGMQNPAYTSNTFGGVSGSTILPTG